MKLTKKLATAVIGAALLGLGPAATLTVPVAAEARDPIEGCSETCTTIRTAERNWCYQDHGPGSGPPRQDQEIALMECLFAADENYLTCMEVICS